MHVGTGGLRPCLHGALLALAAALPCSPAQACTYITQAHAERAMEAMRKSHPSLEAAFAQAARVVKAKVVHQADELFRGNIQVSLEVSEVFKGPPAKRVETYTRPYTSCESGIATYVGHEGIYFIAADGSAHSETQPLDVYPDRPEPMATLRRLANPKQP